MIRNFNPVMRLTRCGSLVLAVVLVGAVISVTKSSAAEPPSPAYWTTLERWAHESHYRGWPLSNRGDPGLVNVVFLYDVSIQAQYLVARNDVDQAAELLLRIKQEWPMHLRQPVDSVKVEEMNLEPWEPKVTNGPSMQLALCALTVSAITTRHRDAISALARDLALRVLEETTGDGQIPYGPGNQRFPDQTPFRQLYNPEYQIAAHTLFSRMFQVTGEERWQVAATRVLQWLVNNRYDMESGRFYANNDKGIRDFPADVPGWTVSMVGPRQAAAAGIDLVKVARDLSQLPARFFITEWLVNRHNGLVKLADYFEAEGMESDAARARSASQQLSQLLLSLPLQSAQAGGGLAYAYRRRTDETGPPASWKPAEGVGTGWGWNTQHGSSRIATIYLLSSLRYGHDPVAGEFKGAPVSWGNLGQSSEAPDGARRESDGARREPDGARREPDGARRDPDGARREPDTTEAIDKLNRLEDLNQMEMAQRDLARSQSLLLAHRMVNPSHGEWKVRVVSDGQTLFSDNLFAFRRYVEKTSFESLTGPASSFAALNLTFQLWEERFLALHGMTASVTPTAPAINENPEVLLLDVDNDFAVLEQFSSRSFQDWLADNNVFRAVELVEGEHGRQLKLDDDIAHIHHLEVGKARRLAVVAGKFVTIDPETNNITRVFASHPTAVNIPLAFKRPLTLTAERYELRRREKPRHVFEEHGQYYEWFFGELNTDMLLAVDVRVFAPDDLAPGDRVIFSPFLLRDAPENVIRSGRLSAEGAAAGMVIAPHPTGKADEPGRVYLRPSIFGSRDHSHSPRIPSKPIPDPTNSDLLSTPLFLPEYTSLTLDWLSDMEAFLHLDPEGGNGDLLDIIRQARDNVWTAPSGERLLVVGRKACQLAESRRVALQRVPSASGTLQQLELCLAFARRCGLADVNPRVSKYETVWTLFQQHLHRLSKEIRHLEEASADPGGRDLQTLRQLRQRYHVDSRSLSFRDSEGAFFALVPGYTVARIRVEVLETLEQGEDATTAPDVLQQALLPPERFDRVSALPEVERYRSYRPALVDEDSNTWVEVATASGPKQFHIYDYAGRKTAQLIGPDLRLDRDPSQPDSGRPTMIIRGSGMFAHIQYHADGRELGSVIVPLPTSVTTGTSARELLSEAIMAARNTLPIVRTEVDLSSSSSVNNFHKGEIGEDGSPTYQDTYGEKSPGSSDVVLIRREYNSDNYETYSRHHFDKGTAKWWPRLTEVFHKPDFVDERTREKRKVEERWLIRVDEQGRPLFEVRSIIPTNDVWAAWCPLPLRSFVPNSWRSWNISRTRFYEVREPDNILYCRYTCPHRNAGEITYYDVDRQRQIFYRTGQTVEIPMYTAHAESPHDYDDPSKVTPFVFYSVTHTALPSTHIANMAVCELNAEATYDSECHSGPFPDEYSTLEALARSHGFVEPPGRRFFWKRHILVQGRPGLRNQRGESESAMVVVEVEDHASVTQLHHKVEHKLPGVEISRQHIPKTPDGRFYLATRDGTYSELTVSGDDTRDLPRGHTERRFDSAAPDRYADLTSVKRPLTGMAAARLSPDGLLAVAFYDEENRLLKYSMEDSLNRPCQSIEAITHREPIAAAGDIIDGNPHGHVISYIDTNGWYWHRSFRRWYPARVHVLRNNCLIESRCLLLDSSGNPLINRDGNATYDVRRFVITPLVLDPEEQSMPKTVFRALVAWFWPRQGEHCHETVAPDGTVLQRATFLADGQVLVRRMNVTLAMELAQRTGTVPEVPLSDEIEDKTISYDARVRQDGTFELTRKGLRGNMELSRIYEKAPLTFRNDFGDFHTWRLRSESLRPIGADSNSRVTWLVYGDDVDTPVAHAAATTAGDEAISTIRQLVTRKASPAWTTDGHWTSIFRWDCPIPVQSERGRVIFSEVGSERRRLVTIINDRLVWDGRSGQLLLQKTQHWPRNIRTTALIDTMGREFRTRGYSGETVGLKYEFDLELGQWITRRARILDSLEAFTTAKDGDIGARPTVVQDNYFMGVEAAEKYFKGLPQNVDLFQVKEVPAAGIGATNRPVHTFYDKLGRPQLQRADATHWEAWTYLPKRDALPFGPASSGQLWQKDIRPAETDFILVYVRGEASNDLTFEVKGRNGITATFGMRTDHKEVNSARRHSIPFWSWTFDDPIVLSRREDSRLRIISVVPLDGHSPDFPIEDQPASAFLLPIAWLPESLLSDSTLSLQVGTCPPGLQMAPAILLGPGGSVGEWRRNRRNQEDLFPTGTEDPRITTRSPKIHNLGNGVVVVHRGRGTASESRVYDHGRLISTTKYIRERDTYHHIRERFRDSAVPHLRFPRYIESAYDGWLCRHVSILQHQGGRLLIQESNMDDPPMVTLLPDSESGASLKPRPSTLHIPFVLYDPQAVLPGLSGNVINASMRRVFPTWERAWNAFPEIAVNPEDWFLRNWQGRTTSVSRYVDSLPLNIPPSWTDRVIPTTESSVRPVSLASLDDWSELVTASMARYPTGLPETHPDTLRAHFADTSQVALIMRGLIHARQLDAARSIKAFLSQATRQGEKPVLDGYEVRQGIGRTYSRLPALAQVKSRPNIAVAHSVLVLAQHTNDPEDWLFAFQLIRRVRDFMPDNDLLWDPGMETAVHETHLRSRANRVARILVTLLDNKSPTTHGEFCLWRDQFRQRLLGDDFPHWLCNAMDPTWRGEWIERLSREISPSQLRDWTEVRVEAMSQVLFHASEALGDRPEDAGIVRSEAVKCLVEMIAVSPPQCEILQRILQMSGGVAETLPVTGLLKVGGPGILTPPVEAFSVIANVEAYELFNEAATLLSSTHVQSPMLVDLRRDIMIARDLQRWWLLHNVLPMAKTHGLCPHLLQEQRPIQDESAFDGAQGQPAAKMLVGSRWPTLEASLAAARTQLMLFPDFESRELVVSWLQNMARVYFHKRPSSKDPVIGFDYVPESMARYEGLLASAQLAVEFHRVCVMSGWEEGSQLAYESLNHLVCSVDGRRVLLTAKGELSNEFARKGIDTGCGITLFPAKEQSDFAWSPAATVLALLPLREYIEKGRPEVPEDLILAELQGETSIAMATLLRYVILLSVLLAGIPWIHAQRHYLPRIPRYVKAYSTKRLRSSRS